MRREYSEHNEESSGTEGRDQYVAPILGKLFMRGADMPKKKQSRAEIAIGADNEAQRSRARVDAIFRAAEQARQQNEVGGLDNDGKSLASHHPTCVFCNRTVAQARENSDHACSTWVTSGCLLIISLRVR